MTTFVFWGPSLNHWRDMETMLLPEFRVVERQNMGFRLNEMAGFREFVHDIYVGHSRKTIDAKVDDLLDHPAFIRMVRCEGDAEAAGEVKERVRRALAPEIERERFVTCHASDSEAEAEYLWALSHRNNIQHARMRRVPRPQFMGWIKEAKAELKRCGIPVSEACVVGSGVLEACGIRVATDLDLIVPREVRSRAKFRGNVDLVSEGYSRGNLSDETIIWGPDHHFYVAGLKFASLRIVGDRKAKSSRPKDMMDTELIGAR